MINRGSLVAAGLAFLSIANITAGKAVRDAWFLASFPVHRLPLALIFTALCSLWIAMHTGRLASRFGPRRLLRAMTLVAGASLIVEWALQPFAPRTVAAVAYVLISVFGVLWVTLLWGLLNERFPGYSARETLPLLAIGGTTGGVFGGLAAGVWTVQFDPRHMLLTLAAINLLGAVLVRLLPPAERPSVTGEQLTAPRFGPTILRTILTAPTLRRVSLLAMAAAATGALADYGFKRVTVQQLSEHRDLLGFMGWFQAALALSTFVVQVGLAAPLLKRWRLVWALSVAPVAVAAAGLIDALVQHWWSAVVLCAVESTLADSIYRSAYELYYAPVPIELKRPLKPVIDVGIERLGTLLGAAVILAFVHGLPNLTRRSFPVLVMAGSLVVLVLAVRVGRDYVGLLRQRLELRDLTAERRYGAPPAALPASEGQPAHTHRDSLVAAVCSRTSGRWPAAVQLLELLRCRPEPALPRPGLLAQLRCELEYLAILDNGSERNRQLRHVLVLIAILTDHESPRSLIGALTSNESQRRSIAIEYLSEVVPPSVRANLLQALLGTTKGRALERLGG
jgi:AAA family ATP:ADP antiporter